MENSNIDIEDSDFEVKKDYSKGGNIVVINNNKVFIEIMEKYHSKDSVLKERAQEEAVSALKSFVYSIIKEKFGTFFKYQEDLYQSGMMGVIIGMVKYDATQSMPTTFFNFYIIHEMTEFINTMVKKTTPHYASNLKKIMHVIDDFEDKDMFYTPADISIATGDLPLQTITKALAIKNSANEMYYENDDFLDSQISERFASPEQQYLEQEETSELYKAISELEPEERDTIKLLYGIGVGNFSHKVIADKLNMPIENVRRIRVKALKKLEKKISLRKLFNDCPSAEENILDENEIEFVPVSICARMMHDLESLEIIDC